VTLRGLLPERFVLADVLLASRDPADARRALAMLRSTPLSADVGSGLQRYYLDARLGWAYQLVGRPDSAAPLLGPAMSRLKGDDEWVFRMAQVEHALGQDSAAVERLLSVADRSPIVDPRAVALLDGMARRLGMERTLRAELARRMGRLLQAEREVTGPWGAERAEWFGGDGFHVRGLFLRRNAARGRRPGVFVLRDFHTPLAAYDSLVLTLNRAGYAVLLGELRGTAHTRDSTFHSPWVWWGREARMRALVVDDVRSGLDALSMQPLVDAGALVVVGLRETAPLALEAAARDPRVRATVVVTPRPGPTQLGTMRAAVERLRAPLYIQTAPEEFDYDDYLEDLYRATDPKVSRLVSGQAAGSGAELCRRDERVRKRLAEWLKETLAAKR
jgi:dienelactone hydrolase